MMNGYLRTRGLVVQRERVRQSLKRIDPLSSSSRWARAVMRRTYSVPTPNSLWHLDSHMKLCRYNILSKQNYQLLDRRTVSEIFFVLANMCRVHD